MIIRFACILFLTFGFVLNLSAQTEGKKQTNSDTDFKNKSTDEIAKDLANPNTPLTSLRVKTQFRTYNGTLEDADNQSSTVVQLQPTLPFPLKNGNKIWIRPAIPYHTKQTFYNENGFVTENGLGDIVIDFQYGGTTKKAMLWSLGVTTTMPSATKNELGINQWAVGPGIQLAYLSKKTVAGGFVTQQWGFGGNSTEKLKITSFQMFAVFLPTGGWNIGTAPIINYDNNNKSWAIPINFVIGKTIKINQRPWKISIETNYFIEQNLPFESKWMIGINIAPVVENYIANWF
ncbi:MAG: hypothetical protein DRJ10_14620 [Bacteroidetes bacterium]|nr:MAG: hypothetical protein DRJ10_14620 [Bacteroidota bacterium]